MLILGIKMLLGLLVMAALLAAFHIALESRNATQKIDE